MEYPKIYTIGRGDKEITIVSFLSYEVLKQRFPELEESGLPEPQVYHINLFELKAEYKQLLMNETLERINDFVSKEVFYKDEDKVTFEDCNQLQLYYFILNSLKWESDYDQDTLVKCFVFPRYKCNWNYPMRKPEYQDLNKKEIQYALIHENDESVRRQLISLLMDMEDDSNDD